MQKNPDEQSSLQQKDSFDQTGLEMLGELKGKISYEKDWSKDRRLNQFFKSIAPIRNRIWLVAILGSFIPVIVTAALFISFN